MFESLLGLFHFSSSSSEDLPTAGSLDSSSLADSMGGTSQLDSVNPATGLPLMGDGHGAIDIGGSPLGTDLHSPFHSGSD